MSLVVTSFHFPGCPQHASNVVSSALLATGFVDEANEVLGKFKWGPNFFELNKEVLDLYVRCESGAEILEAQDLWLARCALEASIRKQKVLSDSLALVGDDFGNKSEAPPSLQQLQSATAAPIRASGEERTAPAAPSTTVVDIASTPAPGPKLPQPDYQQQFQHMDPVTRGLIALTLKSKSEESDPNSQTADSLPTEAPSTSCPTDARARHVAFATGSTSGPPTAAHNSEIVYDAEQPPSSITINDSDAASCAEIPVIESDEIDVDKTVEAAAEVVVPAPKNVKEVRGMAVYAHCQSTTTGYSSPAFGISSQAMELALADGASRVEAKELPIQAGSFYTKYMIPSLGVRVLCRYRASTNVESSLTSSLIFIALIQNFGYSVKDVSKRYKKTSKFFKEMQKSKRIKIKDRKGILFISQFL